METSFQPSNKEALSTIKTDRRSVDLIFGVAWALLFIPSIPASFLGLMISDSYGIGSWSMLETIVLAVGLLLIVTFPVTLLLGAVAGISKQAQLPRKFVFLPFIHISIGVIPIAVGLWNCYKSVFCAIP